MQGVPMFLSGYVQELPHLEGEAVYIGNRPLAEVLEEFDRQNVYVCYAFGDREITPAGLVGLAVQSAEGLVEAGLHAVYSEITGFLWLDQNGMVGGHDLIDIFRGHQMQFGALVIQTEPIDLTTLVEADREANP